MTGIELAAFIIGVVVPTIFKIVDFVIDRFFPNSKADDITEVMKPFIELADNVQDTETEVQIEGLINDADSSFG
ncbi:MAG: hypothetical protein AB8B68_04980 [Rickettsiaceae bacterium]